MVVLEGDKKPEPKPVEPVMEKEVTDEDMNMTHEACHMLFFAMSVLISITVVVIHYGLHFYQHPQFITFFQVAFIQLNSVHYYKVFSWYTDLF